jgi:hypothetical protein
VALAEAIAHRRQATGHSLAISRPLRSGDATSKLGIQQHESVAVQLELPDEAAVLADVANYGAIVAAPNMLIALAGGM